MTLFIDLPIEADPNALADQSIAQLQAAIPGYIPHPGNLEVIAIEAIAPIASETAAQAAQVPAAIWRTFGTKLAGVPYEQGASASTTVTFTLTDTLGHTIPANTELTIADQGFFLGADVVVAFGDDTGTGTVIAVALGSTYNDLSDPVELVNAIDWVSGVTVATPTAGGADQEDDTTYQDRLATQMRLQAPRPITAADYAAMALSFQPAAGTDQQQIGRATSIDGYNPAARTFTATTTNGSATLTAVSDFTSLAPGVVLTGTAIPPGTTIISTSPGSGTLAMSVAATADHTAETVTAGTFNNPRCVCTFITKADGTAPNSDTLTALAVWLASFREATFIAATSSATYTTVYVTFTIHAYAGFDQAAVAAAAQQAVLTYLSGVSWRKPQVGDQTVWLNDTTIRVNSLIGIIERVTGVDYVGALHLGTAPSPTATSNISLAGPAALPLSDSTTVPTPALV